MATIVIIGGGGGQNRTVTETPDGSAVIESEDGSVVAKFGSIADAIAYLQNLNNQPLSLG